MLHFASISSSASPLSGLVTWMSKPASVGEVCEISRSVRACLLLLERVAGAQRATQADHWVGPFWLFWPCGQDVKGIKHSMEERGGRAVTPLSEGSETASRYGTG
jgi:hypothetical protein